jgi:phosphocarrier protein HPr
MASGRFVVCNRLGLHARAAMKLVELASRHSCEVTIRREDQAANAKSVMGVLLLCGSKGTELEIQAEGEGAEVAVAAIGELIVNKFGEGE